MAARYLRFPVSKTGVYQNDSKGKLEFWLMNQQDGRKKLIGECLMSAPQYLKDKWEKHTAIQLKALVMSVLFPDAHKKKGVRFGRS